MAAAGNSNNKTVQAAHVCARGALLVVLVACAGGIALAQNGLSPSVAPTTPSTPPAAPATAAAPQPEPLASPQSAQPPQPAAPAAASQPPAEKRGFFDEFAHWWSNSVADFNAKLKEQQSKLDDLNKKSAEAAKDAATATQQAMKNAADAMVKSATAKVIEMHAPCAIADNGAADCASAAANACKGKGFSDGQPLDVRTAEKCNASLWLQGQGQRPPNAECPVETMVLRAACQ
jgi:hypothetical protein